MKELTRAEAAVLALVVEHPQMKGARCQDLLKRIEAIRAHKRG